MSTTQVIDLVPVGDTIADIANKDTTSASLTTTSSILLSILLIFSFLANVLLVATILSSYKLRNCLLYVCFVNIAFLNILDTIFIMFISLLYLANGTWCFGDVLCRINALMQQFIFLKTLLAITLMAMERSLGLVSNGHRLLAPKYVITLSAVFTIVALCFAAPLMFSSFPVKPYRFRYLCAIASYSPIAYTIVQLWVYSGCLFVLLICFGSMIRHSQNSRSLPVKPQDYSAFIMETRALHDHLSMGKLVFYILLAYLLIQGPYIVLNFFMQMRNSAEILKSAHEFDVPQDADTLITWIKLFFPLLVYLNCRDIWTKLKNLVCCRRSTPSMYNNWAQARPKSCQPAVPPNVLTLVATSEGLQLRVPENRPPVQPAPAPQVVVHEPEDIDPEPNNSIRKSQERESSVTKSKMYGKVKSVPLPESKVSSASSTMAFSTSTTTSSRQSSKNSSPKPAPKKTSNTTRKRNPAVARAGQSKTRKNVSKVGQSQTRASQWKY